MEKKGWRNMIIFIGILVLVASVFISFSGDFPENSYAVHEEEKVEDNFSNVEKLHFSHMPITYSYAESCIGTILPRLEWAFDILENETEGLLSFENINGSEVNINFVCYSTQNVEEGFITYGQSLIEEYSGSVIEKTTIEFWSVREDTRPPSCFTFPNLELHEIMHSFGFDHIENNRYSLMYPEAAWTECIAKDVIITLHSTGETFKPEDKIDDKIVSCLKYIYSSGELGECNSEIKFLDSEGECEEGLYPVENSNYCCQEPNMIIDDEGYCARLPFQKDF